MFKVVSINEVINAMPKSIHIHAEHCKRELLNGNQQAYKFKDLYVVFESWNETLMVQCVEGKGLDKEFTTALKKAALNNGFKYIQFVTPHKALHKMVSDLNPIRVEYRYICKIKED